MLNQQEIFVTSYVMHLTEDNLCTIIMKINHIQLNHVNTTQCTLYQVSCHYHDYYNQQKIF